jgi:hypothetical protein
MTRVAIAIGKSQEDLWPERTGATAEPYWRIRP